jgi:hypothetical protein
MRNLAIMEFCSKYFQYILLASQSTYLTTCNIDFLTKVNTL